jgi:putative transposase
MRLQPRTYALTAVTYQRHRLFQKTTNAELMIATLFRYRDAEKFKLHGFVVMPDHIHVLLTPRESIEKAAQLIKGGFSFAIRNEHKSPIWQDDYHEHRIRDQEDFQNQLLYISNDPARRKYTDYPHVHTNAASPLDPTPSHLS